MRKVEVGLWVSLFNERGVVESVSDEGTYATVRFPQDFPFPQRRFVHVKHLRKFRGEQPQTEDYEPAPW